MSKAKLLAGGAGIVVALILYGLSGAIGMGVAATVIAGAAYFLGIVTMGTAQALWLGILAVGAVLGVLVGILQILVLGASA